MKNIIYIFGLLLLLGCSETTTKPNVPIIKLIQSPITSIAGEDIKLGFDVVGEGEPLLLVENALGLSVIQGQKNKTAVWFTVSSQFTQKSGTCKWYVYCEQQQLAQGAIEITSKTEVAHLETYLGPRSIYAGTTDFTMLVTIPTDVYDNPLSDGAEVLIGRQISKTRENFTSITKNLISAKRIYAVEKASRMLLTSSALGKSSKELTVDVQPAQATGFNIDYDRNHEYADGNQMITFKTSVIKDRYGNVVADGTLATFLIKDKDSIKLTTQGTTINGVAKANMLHPEEEDLWEVTAYVTGAAKSNTALVQFKPAILDYDLTISEKGNLIIVGPVYSFMKQLIPDGIGVGINIYDQNGRLIATERKASRNGFANFETLKDQFKSGTYRVVTRIGGITKEKEIQLHE